MSLTVTTSLLAGDIEEERDLPALGQDFDERIQICLCASFFFASASLVQAATASMPQAHIVLLVLLVAMLNVVSAMSVWEKAKETVLCSNDAGSAWNNFLRIVVNDITPPATSPPPSSPPPQ